MGLKTWIRQFGNLFAGSPQIEPIPERFPTSWREILTSNVSLYLQLPAADAERLERWVLGFLRNIPFEGCSGLEVTDEMRITIAGWASLLVLNRQYPKYPHLHRVLIYPDGYRITEGGFFFPENDTGFDAAGESWDEGYVVLAWSDCLRGIENPNDGFNVILHEFAHQLDIEGGDADGVPVSRPEQWRRWDRIIEQDFERFLSRLNRGRPTAMDEYGAQDRAEFFAVATETFFEKPHAFKQEHPELYGLLREFYGFNPTEWQRPS